MYILLDLLVHYRIWVCATSRKGVQVRVPDNVSVFVSLDINLANQNVIARILLQMLVEQSPCCLRWRWLNRVRRSLFILRTSVKSWQVARVWVSQLMQLIWAQAAFDSDSSLPFFRHHGPCNEGKEGCHESHEGSEGHDQGRPHGFVGWRHWDEEIWHRQDLEQSDRDWHRGGEEVWQVHSSRTVHDQDSPEASNQGWQEVDVRQGGDGEGPACQDCREGKRRCGSEIPDLRPFFRPWRCSQRRLVAPWGIGARLVFGGSAWCTLSHLTHFMRSRSGKESLPCSSSTSDLFYVQITHWYQKLSVNVYTTWSTCILSHMSLCNFKKRCASQSSGQCFCLRFPRHQSCQPECYCKDSFTDACRTKSMLLALKMAE